MAVVASLLATLWSSERLYEGHLKLEGERIGSLARLGELKPNSQLVGVTDRGREVELFRWVNYATLGQDDILADADDGNANCHGWVFTEGGYFLKDPDVEQILRDNGYQPCAKPRTGDLVVYRNPDGAITHTGVVQVTMLGKASLIESKWGMERRFVHPPHVQPYGTLYTFYRSPRQGHSLTIRES
jgi:hypothetical protein